MNMTKIDTSPYAFLGYIDDPYNEYGNAVEQFNDAEVEDFCEDFDPDFPTDGYDPDYIFGLGNKKKRAERKLKRAERKLSKGKTKAAARLQRKAGGILSKLQAGQERQSTLAAQLSDTNVAQSGLTQQLQQAQQPIEPLSVEPMSEIGSAVNTGGSGGAISEVDMGVGAESAAPDTSDEPTGNLAKEKTLGNVTVSATRKTGNTALILIGVLLLIVAIVYFAPKLLKK